MPVKQEIGIVISDKMNKTVVVEIENRYPHPIYSKTLVKTKKYLAHDELEEASAESGARGAREDKGEASRVGKASGGQ